MEALPHVLLREQILAATAAFDSTVACTSRPRKEIIGPRKKERFKSAILYGTVGLRLYLGLCDTYLTALNYIGSSF